MSNTTNIWQPTAAHRKSAHVMRIAEAFGLPTYDALHAHSIADPADYWMRVQSLLGIAWRMQPSRYMDTPGLYEVPDFFPDGALNWVETVLAWGDDAAHADRKGIIAEQEDGTVVALSFAELAQKVRAFSSGLRSSGIVRGDRIGLLMENGVEATVSMLAIAYVGAIAVPLFSGFGVDAIVSRLLPSGAVALIATTGFLRRGRPVDMVPVVAAVTEALPHLRSVIWKPGSGGAVPEGGVTWLDLIAMSDAVDAAEQMGANDPFMIIYTSGTTGKPKGTVHVHGSFPLKIAHDSLVHFDVGAGDVFCWPADMGWVAGTLVLCTALLRGATLVCYDGAPDFPDWSRMSRLVERHRVTHLGSAPTLIRGLAANEETSLAGDRSTVRLLITAGEGIDPDHFTWFRTRFGGEEIPLINYTGGTEVSGGLLSSVIVKPIRPSGFNTGSPGVHVDVVNPQGQSVTGVPGELAIRAPFVGMTHSFWEDDERYLDSYWRAIPGIWVHGDLAIRLDDGSFAMLGRSDDTIKVAGKRLGPAEVEEIVLELPGVREVAAIGVDDPAKGQKLVLFVVNRDIVNGENASGSAISAHVEKRMGKPFKPGRVEFVGQLPKTRSSKVMRRLIKQICGGTPLGDISSLDNPAALDEIRAAVTAWNIPHE